MVKSAASKDPSAPNPDTTQGVPKWTKYLCFGFVGLSILAAITAPDELTKIAFNFHKFMLNNGPTQKVTTENLKTGPNFSENNFRDILKKMSVILAGNPMWKDLRRGTIAAQEMSSFEAAYSHLPRKAQHIPINHASSPELNSLLTEYYYKIGIGGLMQGISNIGGETLLQEIGHNIGMIVASQLKNRSELRDTLAVLATRTTPWRSGIHGVMWHYLQRMRLVDAQSQWNLVLSNDACGSFKDTNPYFYTSCLHGFGHGIYQQHIDDLSSALAVCSIEIERHGGEDALQCATGVYMEYQAGVSNYELTKQQCELDDLYSRACFFRFYTIKAQHIRHQGQSDKGMLVEDFCHDVVDQEKHADCVYGFAKAIYPQVANQDVGDFCLGRYNNPEGSTQPFHLDAMSAVSCVYGAMAMQARGFESEASPEPKASDAVMLRAATNCRTLFRGVKIVGATRRGLRLPQEMDDHIKLSVRLIEACIAGAKSLHSEVSLGNIAWREGTTPE